MLRCGQYCGKVDERYGKIGENHCRKWNYLCVR